MKFECDRCHKRFSTADEPVPGRMYRIPCKCGNTIVVHVDAARASAGLAPERPRRTAPPPLPRPAASIPRPLVPCPAVATASMEREVAAIVDDPFARASPEPPDLRALLAHASDDVTPTILAAPHAVRDPDASPDPSSAYAPPVDPFAEALRRTRTHSLALGGATGTAFGAICAVAITVALLRPWSTAATDAPAPAVGIAHAQLASHPAPDRVLARRKPPVVRASAASAVATAPARAPESPAPPPSPDPAPPPAASPPAADALVHAAPPSDEAAPHGATPADRVEAAVEQPRAGEPREVRADETARPAAPSGGSVGDAAGGGAAPDAPAAANPPASPPTASEPVAVDATREALQAER